MCTGSSNRPSGRDIIIFFFLFSILVAVIIITWVWVKIPEQKKKNRMKQQSASFHENLLCVVFDIRLISWAGKRIDPVGVDYILQKLGFQHARLTIPKWMQRGAMDPLDKVLSMLTYRIIQVLKEPEKEAEEAK